MEKYQLADTFLWPKIEQVNYVSFDFDGLETIDLDIFG